MKKTLLIVFVAILLVSAISIGVMAKGGGMGFRGNALNTLNLTADQKQKILTLRQDFQKNTLNIHNDLQKKNLELQQLWEAATLDQNAINAKTNEINALKIQLTYKQRDLQDKVKGILTPDQQKQLTDKGLKGFGMGMGRFEFGGKGPRFGMGMGI